MNFIRRWLATLFLAAAQLGAWLARKVAPARRDQPQRRLRGR